MQHAPTQKGVIHRDIKPSNVMVTEVDGRPTPKVIDFGVAKATEFSLTDQSLGDTGAIVGTPTYMSPEQADPTSMDIDTRTDVYALGVILYELLAGSPPLDASQFKRGALLEMLRMVREVDPSRPSTKVSTSVSLPNIAASRDIDPARLQRALAGDLDWIVMKALEKDRTRRYETANGFAADILRHLASEPVLAAPPSRSYRMRKFVRKNRGTVIAASLVLLALLAGMAGTLWGLVRAERANANLVAKNVEIRRWTGQGSATRLRRHGHHAIETFHTGVSEDALLKNAEFTELRTKLLKQAAGFYAELERLLAGQTDARSRRTLAAGYYQLAELTGKIDTPKESVRVHRKALAMRRELAAEPGADLETRLDVARSLFQTGRQFYLAGDLAESLRFHEEQRDVAARLEAIDPGRAARFLRTQALSRIGIVFDETGKTTEAMEVYREAKAVLQELADAEPANTEYLAELALIHSNTAVMHWVRGRKAEALESLRKALPIQRKIVAADPANTDFRYKLGRSYTLLGMWLQEMVKSQESHEAFREAIEITQKLADDQPAVTAFQFLLAQIYDQRGGFVLFKMGKPTEAPEDYGKALAIYKRLMDGDPTNTDFRYSLGKCSMGLGIALQEMVKLRESQEAFGEALEIAQKLVHDQPAVPHLQVLLAQIYDWRGFLLLRMGKPTETLEVEGKALAIYQRLMAGDPTNMDFQGLFADVQGNRGEALHRLGRSAEALEAIEAALALRVKASEEDTGKNEFNNMRLIGVASTYGGGLVQIGAGRPAEAAADLRHSLELMAKLRPTRPEARFDRTRSLALLAGLGADARSGVTKEEAAAFADQSVAALAEVVKTGWVIPGDLKESDFDAVRDRADFRKLFAEVEAKAEAAAKDK